MRRPGGAAGDHLDGQNDILNATGGIGPNLTAATLKFGATPKDIYESIAKGRPNGMPAFLPQIGSEKISKVAAFLESLRKK